MKYKNKNYNFLNNLNYAQIQIYSLLATFKLAI